MTPSQKPAMVLTAMLTLMFFFSACSDDAGAPDNDVAATDATTDAIEETSGPSLEDMPCLTASAELLAQVVFQEDGPCHWSITPGDRDQDALMQVLTQTVAGETVCLGEGTFKLSMEVTVNTPYLAIRGAGKGLTTLDFTGQMYGANGLSARSDGFTIEDLTVVNSDGDAIRVTEVVNVTFRNVGVIWTSDADPENGAYGLYPVQCDGVLIEGCEVKGASDAGVYVGQSKNVIVRNNVAHGNVAGIEIENTTDSEVYGNHSYNNTAGILVFNLPGIPIQDGKRAKVHDNLVSDNNGPNFAHAGIVGIVPPGTGILVIASDFNEFHNNTILNNESIGILLMTYNTSVFDNYDDENFDPYPEGNWVHDNTLEGNGEIPKSIAWTFLYHLSFDSMPYGDALDSSAVSHTVRSNIAVTVAPFA